MCQNVISLLVNVLKIKLRPKQLSFRLSRALPGRRRGGGLGDTFTTTTNASYGVSGLLGKPGKPRSAGINGSTVDPLMGKYRVDEKYAIASVH